MNAIIVLWGSGMVESETEINSDGRIRVGPWELREIEKLQFYVGIIIHMFFIIAYYKCKTAKL